MPRLENCDFRGLPAVRLIAPDGATATVTLHGAHVVSWTSPAGIEQLYLSPLSRFEAGQAIRGGVPVVFPQFNTRGPLPRHGFARTGTWAVVEDAGTADDACEVTLGLQVDPQIRSLWPHDFDCALSVALQADRLLLRLEVRNTGSQTFAFQAALHTYFSVGAIESVGLGGLEASDFEDCTPAGANAIQRHTDFVPGEATDRIYFGAPDHLQLRSGLGNAELQHSGFEDVVVWNPGDVAAACPPDLPRDGYRHFVCVEAARIGRPVQLAPAESWSGTQSIRGAR